MYIYIYISDLKYIFRIKNWIDMTLFIFLLTIRVDRFCKSLDFFVYRNKEFSITKY